MLSHQIFSFTNRWTRKSNNLFNQPGIKRRCESQTILYVLHQKTYSRFIHRGNVINNGIFIRYNRDFKKSTNTGELSSAYVSAIKNKSEDLLQNELIEKISSDISLI